MAWTEIWEKNPSISKESEEKVYWEVFMSLETLSQYL